MALRKALVHRLLAVTKPTPPPSANATKKTPTLLERLFHQHRAAAAAAATVPPPRLALPAGDRLIERIRALNGDRVRLDSIVPPHPPVKGDGAFRVSVEDARKVLWAAQLEAAKVRLREVAESAISYSDFVAICCGAGSSGTEHGVQVAKSLDDSGAVIVLGNTVFLRPYQVARAIEGLIPRDGNKEEGEEGKRRRREEELVEMQKRKTEIDRMAETKVKRELWLGLGLLAAQTMGFMRLTFWELSWDVMEPVCFFVTSFYFMVGYAFFLRTSRDPTFEGVFQSRFVANQRRLMRDANFDLHRFQKLGREIQSSSYTSSPFHSY